MNLALKFTAPFLLLLFVWTSSLAQELGPLPPKTNPTEPTSSALESSEASFVTIPHSLPEIPREFRGVWIATVANIDWPLSSTDPWEKQKKDYLALLDYYKGLHFNAVIVQIRTAGDAFTPQT